MKSRILFKLKVDLEVRLGRGLKAMTLIGFIAATLGCTGCSPKEPADFTQLEMSPQIFPDYNGVTIPSNIAPLRFELKEKAEKSLVVVRRGEKCMRVSSSKGAFLFPETQWKDLLNGAEGDSLLVKVYTSVEGKWQLYKPFYWYVAPDQIDPYLAYRLIDPGYELWNKMGLYQRDLTSFVEEPIISNARTGNNCMNCHTFNQQSPDTILFHQRARNGGTYIATSEIVEKLDASLGKDFSGIIYPYWHPSGKCVVFSSNVIRQAFTSESSRSV